MKKESNLIIVRSKHIGNFKKISLLCVQDSELSWRAKGIHNYFVTRPDGWIIRETDLEQRSKDSKGRLDSGISELVSKGYLFRIVKRDEKKRMLKWGYLAVEEPASKELIKKEIINSGWDFAPKRGKTHSWENPLMENTIDGKTDPINNIVLKDNNKKEDINNEEISPNGDNCRSATYPVNDSLASSCKKPVTLMKLTHRRTLPKDPPQPAQRERLRLAASLPPVPPSVEDGPPKVSKNAQEILDYWRDKGLHVAGLQTKEHKKGVKKIEGLFDDGYTIEDFKLSITRFSQATFDPAVYPENKKTFQALSISSFIENKFLGGSLFKKYLAEDPKLIIDHTNIKLLEDKHPNLTYFIEKHYVDNILGTIKPDLTTKDKNHFINAAIRLEDFWENNDSIIRSVFGYGPKDMARLLYESIVNDSSITYQITPGYFDSDTTFNVRLPRYLNEQGVLEPGNRTLSITELNEKINREKREDQGGDYVVDDDDDYVWDDGGDVALDF